MTAIPRPRAHLIERAMKALGGPGAIDLLAPASTPQGMPQGMPQGTPAGGVGDGAALLPTAPVSAAPIQAPASAAANDTPVVISLELMAQAGLVAAPLGTGRSRLLEEVSIVQHQLLRAVQATASTISRCNRVVLVTSARPGEGKSFTSLNIAASIAAGGARPVVLVDADGKRGSLSDLLGIGEARGLRVLAADPAAHPVPLLRPTALGRLSILAYGASLPGALAVPPGATVAAAVLRLAAALPDHLIILDTPPCLSTSDPSTLAPIAGQVLMVVQAERTQRNEVEAALDMVEACPTLQLVLNQARLTANDTFGAYGAYGYGAAAGA